MSDLEVQSIAANALPGSFPEECDLLKWFRYVESMRKAIKVDKKQNFTSGKKSRREVSSVVPQVLLLQLASGEIARRHREL